MRSISISSAPPSYHMVTRREAVIAMTVRVMISFAAFALARLIQCAFTAPISLYICHDIFPLTHHIGRRAID